MFKVFRAWLLSIMIYCLFVSGCGQETNPEPTINPTEPIIEEGTTRVPINTIDKMFDSNQIVSPFLPSDVFVFALPDWVSSEAFIVPQKLHATVIGSCHQDYDWRFQKWLDNSGLLLSVTTLTHSVGMKYTAHLTTDRDNKDGSIPSEEEIAVRDINNNIINFSMPEETNVRIWKSVHYPEWKDYMIKLSKSAVDQGVDILCIDGWTYNYDVIKRGGDFSEKSLSGFNDYLASNFSTDQLNDFGIYDINTFDYREYVRNQPRNKLADEFSNFQLLASKVFWQDIVTETKKYAESQGKNVLFTVNVNISNFETVPGLPIADTVDGFMSEYRFQLPPYNNTITEFKLFRSISKPVILIPNAGASSDFLSRPDLGNLMKIYTAEAFATGEYIYPPYSILASGPQGWQFFNADMEDYFSYYDFKNENKELYDSLQSSADVAVLFSYATLQKNNNDQYYQNFYGISNLLLDMHRQYDVLFLGDNVWLDDSLSLDQLTQYQTIILPNVIKISNKQLDLLLEYTEKGGTIFAFGETGVFNEFDQRRNDNQLNELLENGAHPYGNGIFDYATTNYGMDYLSNKDGELITLVGERLNHLWPTTLQTDAIEKVSIIQYWNSSLGATILHFINHDYDLQTQLSNRQKNVSIIITLDKKMITKNFGVYYLSPDFVQAQELDFTLTDNQLNFIIPELDTYSIVYIGDKDLFLNQLPE